ncbi:MAG TPA: hypothetical protein VKV36_02020 [Acidimicrobiales bacterium]|nr:hypothetical protein [Acidimicrobiales bacterium]
MAARTDGRRITRDDLEEAFARVLGTGESAARAAAPKAVVVGAAAVAALAALAYMAGRRRGRRRSAVVEIRRL